MRKYSRHAEWLNLIEKSGPFLVPSVLESAFPQGLEAINTRNRKIIRNAFHEWGEAIDDDDPLLPQLHDEWIHLVLNEVLDFDDQSLVQTEGEFNKYSIQSPVDDEIFSPDFLVISPNTQKPKLFISTQAPGTRLEKTNQGSSWPVSLMDRMTQLCRKHGVRLGLLTNGAQWTVVNAPVGETSSNTSWFARLWFQEPVTFQAFQTLLGVRRFFGPEEETLEALLQKSTEQQEEITDTLGEQVRRAVEVLTQCLDKIDSDRNRALLKDVAPSELYEAGLTVMMRLVFTMCAEERGLLHLNDPTYEANYAVSTLRNQLEEDADRHGFEVLERRHDAWARLLAVFRAIYGGIEHEDLRLPALGGSLFDPDRFPFLEGRKKETNWKETPSKPLPIDNRTVLLLLSALQVLEQSSGALLLSYKALDVEQIGHVYEGLLEHTVERLPRTTLGLIGSKKAKYPNLTLSEIESLQQIGTEALSARFKEVTLRSESAIKKGLSGKINDDTYSKIIAACGGDVQLADRIRPFGLLLRSDAWGELIVYQKESFAVTLGSDRRETGTHYTPKSLTESIVETTLEPIVYSGPAEGKPREEWILKSSKELLDLKICDPAMGSGAFLVQVCRWLSEKVVEAWKLESLSGKFISVDGSVLEDLGDSESLDESVDEQVLIARRLVAEKCLYGVDVNPLAVELAKLSIWLITLAKDRPFGFLDHNLRAGDSLLGIHKLEQLYSFDLHADDKTPKKLFAQKIDEQVHEALVMRKQLRETPIRDVRDVQHMESLNQQARQRLEHIGHIADAMIGEALASGGNQRTLETAMDNLSTWSAAYIEGDNEIGWKIITEARKLLSIDFPAGKPPRKPFHWALQFPEVFGNGGFDGIIGNPPFLGGRRLRGTVGTAYLKYLTEILCPKSSANADLCAFFFRRSAELIASKRAIGLISTNSIGQGDTRIVGLGALEDQGFSFFRATSTFEWPGAAGVSTALVWVFSGDWKNSRTLNNKPATYISSYLLDEKINEPPHALAENFNQAFQGSNILGNGFVLTEDEASAFLKENSNYEDVIQKFLKGDAFNSSPNQQPTSYIINFHDWPLDNDTAPGDYNGPVASDYPLCLERITKLVKPQRDKAKRKPYRERWWQYAEKCGSLYEAARQKKRVIFHASPSKHIGFGLADTGLVYSGPHTVIVSDDISEIALLQSSLHTEWAWKYCSTMRNAGIRYNPSDYRVFPGLSLKSIKKLAGITQLYFNHRASIMTNKNIGLTTLYNLFHSADEQVREIIELRALHMEMDHSVARAYDWGDIHLEHGFYETKQGVRFTISEAARQEVLQRLLKLNHERYEEEVQQGLHSKKKSTKAKSKAVKQVFDSQQTTFLKDT
jgi:hypothetical protein